jgi:hypothetical protein
VSVVVVRLPACAALIKAFRLPKRPRPTESDGIENAYAAGQKRRRASNHRPLREVTEITIIYRYLAVNRIDDEGALYLSERRARALKTWEKVIKAHENDEVIEATVT